jgi:hypothetical protein
MAALQFTAHDDAASFRRRGAFLRAAEAENSIISAPATRISARPHDDDAGSYFVTVSDAGVVVAAAFHGSSGGVLVTAGPDPAFALIAADLAGRERKPKSVVGPLAACEAFARAWREHTGQTHALRFHLRHFALTQIPHVHPAGGCMRAPGPGEYELIADWQTAFNDELRLPEDAAPTRRKIMQRIERGSPCLGRGRPDVLRRLWRRRRGHRASRRCIAHPRSAATATHGAGSGCRANCSRWGSARFFTTDVGNPTSNSIYQMIGYRRSPIISISNSCLRRRDTALLLPPSLAPGAMIERQAARASCGASLAVASRAAVTLFNGEVASSQHGSSVDARGPAPASTRGMASSANRRLP